MNTPKTEKEQPKQQPSVADVSTIKQEVEKLAEEKDKPELVQQFKNLLARNRIQVF